MARNPTALAAVCGACLVMAGNAAAMADQAAFNALRGYYHAANFDAMDAQLAAAQKALTPATRTALRLEVNALECETSTFESDDPGQRWWNGAQQGIAAARVARATAAESLFEMCSGNILAVRGQFPQAQAAFDRGHDLARRVPSRVLQAMALTLRGGLASKRGDFRQALLDQLLARELFQAANAPASIVGTTNEIAMLYARLGDHQAAISYYQQVYDALAGESDMADKAIILGNLSVSNNALGKTGEALRLIEEALRFAHASGDPVEVAAASEKKARVLLRLNRHAEVVDLLAPVRGYLQRQGLRERQAQVEMDLAEALLALHRHGEALELARASAQVFAGNRSLLNLLKVRRIEAKALAETGDFANAYAVSQQAREIADRLAEQSSGYSLVLTQVALQVGVHKGENVRLRREVAAQQSVIRERDRAQRWQRAAMLFGGLTVLFLLWFGWRQLHRARQLHHLSRTDELTGLANRRAIVAYGRSQLAYARRMRLPFSLLVFDIDCFKKVNDTWGHAQGDKVLQHIAAQTAHWRRPADRVGRLGGEEFVAVMPHVDASQARGAAEQLRALVERSGVDTGGQALHVTVSIGVVSAPPAAGSFEALIELADAALYAAKRNGRNRVEVASAGA